MKCTGTNNKRRRAPVEPIDHTEYDASPVPSKRTKISKENSKQPEVATGSGNTGVAAQTNSKEGRPKGKKRKDQEDGNNEGRVHGTSVLTSYSNVMSLVQSGTSNSTMHHPSKQPPVLKATPQSHVSVELDDKQGDADSEDDIPLALASKSIKRPRAPVEKPDEERVLNNDATHESPRSSGHTSAHTKKRPRNPREVVNGHLENHRDEDDHPPPQKPLRSKSTSQVDAERSKKKKRTAKEKPKVVVKHSEEGDDEVIEPYVISL